MLVRPKGMRPLFGPVFRPAEQGPCWACLAHRLRGHQEVHDFLRNVAGDDAAFRPCAAEPALLDAVYGFVAAEVAKWLVLRDMAPVHERAISLDSAAAEAEASITPSDAEAAPQPFDELRAKFLCADLNRALATLDVRERTILRLRFGLGGREPLRLVDVGNRLGLTAERIRQLQAQALAKLRRTSAARILEGYAAG